MVIHWVASISFSLSAHLDVLNYPRVHCLLEAVVGVCVECIAGLARPLALSAVSTWSLARCVCHCHLCFHALNSLVGCWEEDDFAVGSLGHGLHGLKVPDLHG